MADTTKPDQPGVFRVDLLDFGLMPRCPETGVFMHGNLDARRPWAYTGLLCRSADTTVVINTGFPLDMTAVQEAFHAWNADCDVERDEAQTLDGNLRRLGVEPAEVDHLVLSCLGPYSTGRVELFDGCPVHVGRSEWVDLLAPPPNFPTPPRDTILPADTLRHLLYEQPERLNLLEDEDTVCPGLQVFRTGGHHHGSLAVLIDTARGTLIYADTLFTYDNFERNLPIGFYRSQDEFHAAVRRIGCEADVVLPFFDPAVFERYPDGIVVK